MHQDVPNEGITEMERHDMTHRSRQAHGDGFQSGAAFIERCQATATGSTALPVPADPRGRCVFTQRRPPGVSDTHLSQGGTALPLVTGISSYGGQVMTAWRGCPDVADLVYIRRVPALASSGLKSLGALLSVFSGASSDPGARRTCCTDKQGSRWRI